MQIYHVGCPSLIDVLRSDASRELGRRGEELAACLFCYDPFDKRIGHINALSTQCCLETGRARAVQPRVEGCDSLSEFLL